MNHLDDGTLQAFLDDELAPEERAGVAEHVLVCDDCRASKEELVQATATFSEKVAILDVAAPSVSQAPARGRSGLPGGTFVKAASLTLLLAAAASAAVPGSPVRQWIDRAVEPETVRETTPVASEPELSPPAPAPLPAGVALVPTGPMEIVLTGLEGSTIRLVETDGPSVVVSAVGAAADPVFHTAPGTIGVRGGEGGEVTVELPRSMVSARLMVDGRLYAEKVAGQLEIHVPAETAEGVRIWR